MSTTDAVRRSRAGVRREGRARFSRVGRLARRSLPAILRWLVLAEFAYALLFPMVFMFSTSIKPVSELSNPAVNWIPHHPTIEGYRIALVVVDYFKAVGVSAATSLAAAVGQTAVGAMIAYGLARLRFPGRNMLYGILLFTIIVPLGTIFIPQFIFYSKLQLTDTYIPIVLPAFLGWGVRGGILLVVYRQFFLGLPYELEDAAYADGAGPFRTFWRIMLPLAKPATLVVFLFSFVWTWNDTFIPSIVLRNAELFTLPQRLTAFGTLLSLRSQMVLSDMPIAENTFMAAVALAIAPMLLLYMVAQRYFTQSIDRTGLVE